MEGGNGNERSGDMQIFQSPFSAIGVSQMGGSTMRQSSPSLGPDTSKRIGVPPSHPNNPQIMATRSGSQNLNRGPSHSRSLSQSAVFSLDCLPPLSPLPCLSSGSNQSPPAFTDISMEDRGAGGSHGILLIPSPVTGTNDLRVNESLPPCRGHRRSMSDSVPLGFSAIIQSSPQLIPIGNRGALDRSGCGRENSGVEKSSDLVKRESEWSRNGNSNIDGKFEGVVVDDLLNACINFDNMETLNSSGTEDKDLDSRASGTKTNGAESSDNEVESRVKEGLKRSADGDIARSSRHYRSVSMDSYMENLQFDIESLKFPPIGSATNSMDGKLAKFNMEFGNAEFNEEELKKIMANEKLTEIAMVDPKRAKRILANRLSAARSKERKMRYISELEHKVQTLQTEATKLSAQVTVLQRDSAALTSQNNELKFCLQAMEQQAKLKDALNEALAAEVQHLRLAAAELRGDAHQQLSINHQMLKLQLQEPTQLNSYRFQQEQQKELQQLRQQHQHNPLQSQQQNS